MLRSLFHGQNQDPINGAIPQATSPQELSSPENVEIRRIEDSANELRNLSPARPYYYKKPPAPDPPKSPEDTPPPSINGTISNHSQERQSPVQERSPKSSRAQTRSPLISHITSSVNVTSRSSTPDLPPPPPPPPLEDEDEVVICDEPLPPPPCEVSPEDAVKAISPPTSPVDSASDEQMKQNSAV